MQSEQRQAEIVWAIPSTFWIQRTIPQLLTETTCYKHRRLHKLATHLSTLYPADTICSIGVRGARSITIGDTEYRIRNDMVYQRELA